MKFERPVGRSVVWLAGAMALMAAATTVSEARKREVRAAKACAPAAPVQQQKPIRLRYYGGPKSPMYPEVR